MNYTDFKNKTFSENPAVKAEYDQLGPQYEAIRVSKNEWKSFRQKHARIISTC